MLCCPIACRVTQTVFTSRLTINFSYPFRVPLKLEHFYLAARGLAQESHARVNRRDSNVDTRKPRLAAGA